MGMSKRLERMQKALEEKDREIARLTAEAEALDAEIQRGRVEIARLYAARGPVKLGRPPAHSAEFVERVKASREAGASIRELSRQYDISTATVQQMLRGQYKPREFKLELQPLEELRNK